MSTPLVLTAEQKRARHPDFVPTFSLAALRPRLPLRFPIPAGTLPSPKTRYRSCYTYPGPDALADPRFLETASPFEVTLRLISLPCGTSWPRPPTRPPPVGIPPLTPSPSSWPSACGGNWD